MDSEAAVIVGTGGSGVMVSVVQAESSRGNKMSKEQNRDIGRKFVGKPELWISQMVLSG